MDQIKTNEQDVKLKGNMGMFSLILIGIAAMSPNVIYLYAGIIPEITQGMYALTITVTAIVMFFSALSYARMSKIYQKSGSVYVFTSRSIGPKIGFIAGWAIIADYLLLPMVCYLSFGLYLHAFIPGIPVWAWILMGMVICAVLSVRGVQVVKSVNSFVTTIAILFLIFSFAIIVAYIAQGGGAGTFFDPTAYLNPDLFVLDNILMASGIFCCGFVGFDVISTMSEETKDPEKTIPRAIILCCVISAIVFIIMAYVLQLAWPAGYQEMENPDTGILEMFAHVKAAWLIPIFSILKALTALMCCLAGTNAVSRVLYNMGKENFIPKRVFGYLHPKYRTPVHNILIATAIGFLSIVFSDNLSAAASLVSFGALVGFTFTNASCFAHYYVRSKVNRTASGFIRYGILPLFGVLCCIYLVFSLALEAKVVGLCWLAIGILYLAIKTKGFKENPQSLEL